LYQYALDGGAPLPDPVSRAQPQGVHGPSAVVDLAYPWRHDDFRPAPLRQWAIYELHIGTFTAEGTFAGAAAVLDDLADLGVTAVEVMPVAPFPGTRNWGYDGVFPFAVQDSYGGPRGLQHFVDQCHARRIAVVLDVVYNHLGPEGNVLGEFAPYFTDRYVTPWGEAINLDGPGSDGVRDYLVANARQWFERFHVDGLRLDAVHELIDRGARPFLAELSNAVREVSGRTGRQCVLVAESADNNPLVVTPAPVNGLGMDAQWNDDFHHAVHAALTRERDGYYVDFGRADDVARAMDQGFVYQGAYSEFRRRRHGAPSVAIPPEAFVTFVQNHDQVGNRADGARLSMLVPPERVRLAAALLLLSPGVPLLFMGEEYGEVAPFAYFVDHGDPGLLDAVRRGRAAEHAHHAVGPLPDPADPATFAAAILHRSLRDSEGHRDLWALYRDLLALRRDEPALHCSTRDCSRAHADGSVVTLVRSHAATTIAAYFNLSGDAGAATLPHGCWERLLDSATPHESTGVPLRPWDFAIFRDRSHRAAHGAWA
jgi:maltooligosyltrehalose trehalohydrolase